MYQVTVGTTSFDDLVKEVDAESFQEQAEWFLRNLWIFHFSSMSARPRHLATSAWSFNEVVEATGAALAFTVTLPPRSLVRWKVEPTRSTDSGGRVQHLERWRKDFYFNLFIMKRTDKSIRNCHPIFPKETVSRAW